MKTKPSWQMKRHLDDLNRRLAEDPNDHEAWLDRLDAEGNLECIYSMTGLLARLMERGIVSRRAILEELGGRLCDRYSVVVAEAPAGRAKYSVQDDTGALVKTFDSVMDALEYIDALRHLDFKPESKPEPDARTPVQAVADTASSGERPCRSVTHEMLFDIGKRFGTLA